MTKSYIKEAEQNVINQAKFWNDFIELLNSMESGMRNITDHWSPGRQKMTDGFALLQQGAYEEQQHALARCFVFVGVGGEAARNFSRERAMQVFGNDRSKIQWLDSWNRVPSAWRMEDENGFDAEVKAAMSKGTES